MATTAGRLRKAVVDAGGNATVSRKSGVGTTTLHTYLSGSEMKLGTLVRLAEACGVSPSWLMFGELGPALEADPAAPTLRLSEAFMLTAVKALELSHRVSNGPLPQEKQVQILIEWYHKAQQAASSSTNGEQTTLRDDTRTPRMTGVD